MSIFGERDQFLHRENDLHSDNAKIDIMSKIVV